jgi:hypothetical protein
MEEITEQDLKVQLYQQEEKEFKLKILDWIE